MWHCDVSPWRVTEDIAVQPTQAAQGYATPRHLEICVNVTGLTDAAGLGCCLSRQTVEKDNGQAQIRTERTNQP